MDQHAVAADRCSGELIRMCFVQLYMEGGLPQAARATNALPHMRSTCRIPVPRT